MVNEGRKIFQAELLLTEVPKLGLLWIKRRVVLCVPCASIVAKPDIIALAGKNERRRQLNIVSRPKVHVALKTMHHEDGWLFHAEVFTGLSWDAIHLRDVAIFGDDCERLRGEPILVAYLNEVVMVVFILLCKRNT